MLVRDCFKQIQDKLGSCQFELIVLEQFKFSNIYDSLCKLIFNNKTLYQF